MYLVYESEIFHHGESLTKRIENLSHGRYLPVKVPAVDTYVKGIHLGLVLGLLTGIYLHINKLVKELEPAVAEPEVLRRVHKLHEVRDGKGELLEEEDLELLEARGRYPTNNCFHVSADASEPKVAKVRKCDMSQEGYSRLHIKIANREVKEDDKCLQLRHECNPLEQFDWLEIA
jgi:hypothetical protein